MYDSGVRKFECLWKSSLFISFGELSSVGKCQLERFTLTFFESFCNCRMLIVILMHTVYDQFKHNI